MHIHQQLALLYATVTIRTQCTSSGTFLKPAVLYQTVVVHFYNQLKNYVIVVVHFYNKLTLCNSSRSF